MMSFLHDVHAPHTNEAYTAVCLPASATKEWPHSKSKLTMGQVEMLYHCVASETSILIALTKQVTQLSLMQATLGSLPTMIPGMPLFGSLHRPITWQPGSPSAQPHQINSFWYLADTPGPALLGLQSCERLEVVKMSCAVKVIQDTSHLPGPPQAPPTPKKTVPIKSTEDLIKTFPNRFEDIGQFPGDYTIRLCNNAQPVIHPPKKCPISIHPEVKEELDKMVKLGVITPVDIPTDWVSSVAYAWKMCGE